MIQLKEFISSIINSSLGPNKCNKFFIQDKDVCLTRCPLHIFQSVPFQNLIVSLLEETILAHHNLYGCSTLSLLAMWYFWNEELKLAIDEGCDIQDIIKHSSALLKQVISAVSDTSIAFDTMIPKRQNSMKNIHKDQKISTQFPLSIQYSSRHFSPSGNFLNLEDSKFDKCSELDESCLKKVVQSLDHDDNAEISDLILECWKRQIASSNSYKFTADGILICPIVLPCSSSTVIDGLVIKSYLNYSHCPDLKATCSNRSLLIKCSITYEYVHLGFSPKVKISGQQTSFTTNKEIWIKKTCDFIKELNLDVLLVKDDIEPEIVSFCLTHSIFVLSHIPLMLFKKLSNVLEYSPCNYITDCTQEDVKNLIVKAWKPKEDAAFKDEYFLINIGSENRVKLQTIVICHPCQAVLELNEHQIHHLISRISLSFESNSLLPGGGISEEWCYEYLNKLLRFYDLSDPTSRIIKALANGFKHYAATVFQKKLLCANQGNKILDEMSSKLNAWRSALSLLLQTHQCNLVITNDTDGLHFQNLCNNTS